VVASSFVTDAFSRTGGSGGAGGAGSSAAPVAAGSQQRSQPMSQHSYSQGAVGSGGASSLLHSQSQLSQASLDENLLTLHLASPARDQVPSAPVLTSRRCSCVLIVIGDVSRCALMCDWRWFCFINEFAKGRLVAGGIL
jgi:hypothetical protein